MTAGAAAIGAAVSLAACGSSSAPAASSSTTPIHGGTIRYAHNLEVPCLQGGWVEEAYVERQYADSLVSQARGGRIVPWLASSWSISRDRRTYVFHIKPGVRFSDGTPLNAKAVVANFYFWMDPKSGNSDVQSFIGPYFKSARALGPLTVQVRLKRPYAPLLASLSQGYDGILSPKGLARGVNANCVDPIGSGPWILQRWNHGQDLVFRRNPHYDSWPANARHHGPPYAKRLVWSFVTSPTTRYASLTSGESDVIEDVPTDDWSDAKRTYNLAEYVTPGRPETLSLDTAKGVFTDERVRQAFAYAINRRAAVRSAFNGEIPFDGNGALSPSTPMYDRALNDSLSYDPARAASLLDEAGWSHRDSGGYRTKDGRELDIRLVYGLGSIVNDEGATLLQDLQQEWKAAGFHVTLVPATLTQLNGGQFDMPGGYDATLGYWTSPTPGVMYIVYRPFKAPTPNYNNSAFYDNPAVVKTIARANSVPDPKQRQALYAQAQRKVVDRAVVVGLYTKTTTLAWSKRLHDVWIEDAQGEPVFSDAYFAR